jgi:hypothetical protein
LHFRLSNFFGFAFSAKFRVSPAAGAKILANIPG